MTPEAERMLIETLLRIERRLSASSPEPTLTLTLEESAQALGCSKRQVRALIARQQLDVGLKVGRRVMVLRRSLERLLSRALLDEVDAMTPARPGGKGRIRDIPLPRAG